MHHRQNRIRLLTKNWVSLEIAEEIPGILYVVISKRPKLQGPRATFRVLQVTVQFQCTGLDCTALTGPTHCGGSLPISSVCPGRPARALFSLRSCPSCLSLRWSLLAPTRAAACPTGSLHLTSPSLFPFSPSAPIPILSSTSISLSASPPPLVQFQQEIHW